MPNKTSKFEELIEKYRIWIGVILILAIVGGSAVLIWRENYSKPKLEDRISVLEDKIDQFEAEKTISKSELQISNENSNIQTEQGMVAGVNSNSTVQQSNNSTAQKSISGKININTATVAELDTLPGIGPAYAGRIIDYRNANGGFKTIDELDNVKGIGKTTIDKFRDQVTI